MATKLFRDIRERVLDNGVPDSPFEKVGYQNFLKFDSFVVQTTGSVVFSYCGKEIFTISPDGKYVAGENSLHINGVEGRMRFDIS